MSNIALITGANRGIGLEFVKHYRNLGWQVVALCRESNRTLEQTGAKVVTGINVALDDCTSRIREVIGDTPLDLVINNAGILRDERLGNLDYNTIREQFEVNTLGPLRVTEAVLANLKTGSKIALVTSRMGSIADNSSGGRYGYRMSKAALNAAGVSLARDLETKQIAVALLHPGYVATDMVGGHGDITPDVAASRLAERIEELNMSNTGSFWHSNGELLPW